VRVREPNGAGSIAPQQDVVIVEVPVDVDQAKGRERAAVRGWAQPQEAVAAAPFQRLRGGASKNGPAERGGPELRDVGGIHHQTRHRRLQERLDVEGLYEECLVAVSGSGLQVRSDLAERRVVRR
jgi:hypothetical protein